MSKNDLETYFGKKYKTNPEELSSLKPDQKKNVSLIIDSCKKAGIKNDFVIAAILATVSKESNFKATTEGSFKKTEPQRIRGIFGPKRTSKYTDDEIESFKKDDKIFFDFVYGPVAKEKGYSVYGNDSKGDGFKYRGRGFNQLTFKNIYRDRGTSSGFDLVKNPELVENVEVAASVLVDFFIYGFSILKDSTAKAFGINKSKGSLNTINSIDTLQKAIDGVYTANAGWGSYESVIKYKSNSKKDSNGLFYFPDDKVGGYTRVVNRTPIFYQILTGNKLDDSELISPSDDFSIPTETGSPDFNTESQDFSGDSNSDVDRTDTFNPIQLTQYFKPTISVNRIELDAVGSDKKQKKDFLVNMGAAPFVQYNGIHIEYTDFTSFELYHEGIIPATKMTFMDRNGIFKDIGFPTDDTLITIFLYSGSKRLRSILMDFKITNFKDIGSNKYSLTGLANIPRIYLSKFNSYSNMTSYNALKELAKQCELGFCSNISDTNDEMTWINNGSKNYKFISDVISNAYLSDESYLSCYVDFYYNLCYVDLEKEYQRDNLDDKQLSTQIKRRFSSNPSGDDDIVPLFLSTDKSASDTVSFISRYQVLNKSTQVSLNNAYITKNKFYDSNNKELLIFNTDSITPDGGNKIIMKGKPNDETFYKENINNIWTGKLDSDNMHKNFNYSTVQNRINIRELNKIQIEIHIPNANYNLYIFQKVRLALINDKPGANQSSLNYKRLSGNWLITDIRYTFNGNDKDQIITLVRKELELSENEIEKTKSGLNETFEDNDNQLSPGDVDVDRATIGNRTITERPESVDPELKKSVDKYREIVNAIKNIYQLKDNLKDGKSPLFKDFKNIFNDDELGATNRLKELLGLKNTNTDKSWFNKLSISELIEDHKLVFKNQLEFLVEETRGKKGKFQFLIPNLKTGERSKFIEINTDF